MSGGRWAARVRFSLCALWVVALAWSLSGTALAAAPASPDPAASGIVAQPDVPGHAGAVAPKPKDGRTRPSDLLSPMGRRAQKAQAALAKKQGRHFDSLDKDICGDQQECEEENSDPDFDGPAGGQAETSIAVDSSGQHIVVGFNDTRGFALNPMSVSGFMYSDDGGATFADGGQLPSPGTDLIGVSQTLVLAGLLGGAIFSAFLFLPGLREQDTGLPAVSRVQ